MTMHRHNGVDYPTDKECPICTPPIDGDTRELFRDGEFVRECFVGSGWVLVKDTDELTECRRKLADADRRMTAVYEFLQERRRWHKRVRSHSDSPIDQTVSRQMEDALEDAIETMTDTLLHR